MQRINISNLSKEALNTIPGFNKYFDKIQSLYGYEYSLNQTITLHCDIGSDNLLVVAGESWTFGDSLKPFVCINEGKDDIPYRISTNFAGKLANYLNCDLLLVAKPGDSNLGILDKMTIALEEVQKRKQYRTKQAVCQFTSPGRDLVVNSIQTRPEFNHITQAGTRNFKEWNVEYENTMIECFLHILDKYEVTSKVFWKNFYPFVGDISKFKSENTKFHLQTWSEFLFELGNIKTTHAEISELKVDFENFNYLNNNIDYLIDNSENWNKYLDCLNASTLNDYHPTDSGHWLWMNELRQYLYKYNTPIKKYKAQLI